MYLLDTNICVALLNKNRPIATRFNQIFPQCYTSILVLAELYKGTYCSQQVQANIDNLIKRFPAGNDTCKIIDDYLSKLSNEKNFSGALLIVKDGKKIFTKGYGWANKDKNIPFTTGTLASIGSITKAFTATAIMKVWKMCR